MSVITVGYLIPSQLYKQINGLTIDAHLLKFFISLQYFAGIKAYWKHLSSTDLWFTVTFLHFFYCDNFIYGDPFRFIYSCTFNR